MRGLHEVTQHDHLRVIGGFANFLGRAPDTTSAGNIRRFQVYQAESGVQPLTVMVLCRRAPRPSPDR